MGYMKRIDIDAQNIFEEKISFLLDNLEDSIDELFKQLERAENLYTEHLLIESIGRCYYMYSLIQTEFW